MVGERGEDFTTTRKSNTYPYVNPTKLNLSGKSVFITGASKGIGAALAVSFAKAGASIIGLGARGDLSELASSLSGIAAGAGHPSPKVLTYTLDVTSGPSIATAASEFSIAAAGRLDIVIANAGYLSDYVPLLDSDPADWWRTWEINVNGIHLTTRYFLPLMLADSKSECQIIFLSSAGAHSLNPGGTSYSTSKLAVLRFAEILSAEYGSPPQREGQTGPGLLTYSVHPGGILTDMGTKFTSRMNVKLGDTPELAADTITWLASERREWLAGRYVSANWDMEEFEKSKKEEVVKGDLLKVKLRVE